MGFKAAVALAAIALAFSVWMNAGVLINVVVILLGTWLLEWIFRKLAPKHMESLRYVTKTVPIVAVSTAFQLYIMTTRPEDRTLGIVGPVITAGVLVAGYKILWNWGKTRDDAASDEAARLAGR